MAEEQPRLKQATIVVAAKAASALLLIGTAYVVLFYAIQHVRERDWVGAIVLVLTGLPMLAAGVELMRPHVGE